MIPNARKFKPGQSGHPPGPRPKLFEEALRRALMVEDKKTKSIALRRIAEKLIGEAESGNVQAIKEIAERIDGKVPQAQEISGPDGAAIQTVIQVSFVGNP